MKVQFHCILAISYICSTFSLTAQESAQKIKFADIQKADSFFFASNYKSALKEYQNVLQIDSNKTKAITWNRLGFCYQNLGNIDEAIKAYQTSLQNKPQGQILPIVHSRLAKSYALKKDQDKMYAHLDQAVANGFMNPNDLDTAREFNVVRNNEKFKAIVKKAQENAFPCMSDAHNREFDFWVGEWDAFVTGTNNLAGRSVIQKASGDCMILENWTSAGTSFNGKSMNFIDPKTNKWEQVWVGSDGKGNQVGRFYNGVYNDNVMQFEFESTDSQGNKAIGRFRFFNQGANQVRQLSETSSDGGKTWTINYDFTYKRKK